MCHRVIRTICPSCLRPAAYPQRHRLDQCFPPKIYTGWAPATAMYEKHRTEEETIPDVCHRCRYRGLWGWYDTMDEEDETVGRDEGKNGVEELEAKTEVKVGEGKGKGKGGKTKGEGKKKKANVKSVEWSTGEEESVGQKKGIIKEVEVEVEEKQVPKNLKGKRKAGEDVEPQEVETKRRRFP